MTNYPYSPDNNITLPTVAIQTQTPIVDGSPAGGDLGGTYPNPSLVNIQGNPVLASGVHQPAPNQVLQWNGLAWVPGTGAGGGSFTAGRDLAGSNTLQTVIGLQSRSLSATAPTVGQVIAWNGTQWIPTTPASGGAAGGDLTGTYPNPTIAKLQGITLTASSPSSGQILTYNGSAWVAASFTGSAGGDLSGTYPNPIVSGLQGRSVLSTSPTASQVLTWNGAAWAPGSATTFTAGGDLSGTNTSQTVIAINGATVPVSGSLTTGNVLQVSGGSALTYAPVNLAGGPNFVTGTLPVGNLPIATTIALGVVKLAGDLGGTDLLPRVLLINGSSVPAGGSLTTGNVLQASGSSSLTYAQLNLANANSVTGTLAATGITSTTPSEGQFVIASSPTAYQPYTISGDATASVVTPGDLTVIGIQQNPVPVPALADGYDTVLTYTGSSLIWTTVGSGTYPTGPATGDLAGSYPGPSVIGLQGYPIHYQVLGGIDDGYVLTFGSDGYWSAEPVAVGGAASGDLSGLYPDPTVVAIQGNPVQSGSLTSLDDGYVLTWKNSADQWQALPATSGGSLAGDVTGPLGSNTVVALQGHPVHSQTLGPSFDGYVLTWDNTDGYWKAAIDTDSAADGSLTVYPFANITSTNSTTFVSAGTFEFDPTPITSVHGSTTMSLRVVAQTTGPVMTIQLYNLTTASVVTGSTLTTSSTIPVTLATGDLSANMASTLDVYQIQIEMAAGGPSDQVTLSMATLKVTWS